MDPGGLLAGYFAAYPTTPRDLVWQLDSSLERLLLHVSPIVLLALGSAVAPTVRAAPDP